MPGLQRNQIWKASTRSLRPLLCQDGSKKRGVERGREEIRSTAGELAVPQEFEDMPIPPGLRPESETCHEGSDSSCKQWQLTDGRQPCSCRDADTQNSMTDEPRMDVESEERDESRSSKTQNTRRRNAPETSLEENKSDETTVAVTTQESLDGSVRRPRGLQASMTWGQAAV